MNAHAWTRNAQRLIGTMALGLIVFCASRAIAADDAKTEPIVVGTPARIEVFPAQVKIEAPRREMHLVVTGHYADGSMQDLTRVADIAAKDEQIARTEKAAVLPVANGQTEVTVKVGGHEAKVPVEVAGQETPDVVSFNYRRADGVV